MPRDFRYFQAPQASDPTPLYGEMIRNAGSGVRAAGAALSRSISEGIDIREQRRAREDDRKLTLERDSNQQAFARSQQILGEDAAMIRERQQQTFQHGENAMNRAAQLEIHNLSNISEDRRAGSAAAARVADEERKTRFTTDKQMASTIANTALSNVLNPSTDLPFIKHAKINPRTIFNTNESDDDVMNTLLGANAAARPYLDPDKTKKIGDALKLYTKDQPAAIFDPTEENVAGIHTYVANQVQRGMRTNGLNDAQYQAIEEALQERIGKLPSNEHQAAESLRDSTQKTIQGIFGTTAPAAQQTQSLDKLGLEGTKLGAPQSVTVAAGDLSDDMYTRIGGSQAAGAQLKNLLVPIAGPSAKFVPVPDGNGGVHYTVEGMVGATLQQRRAVEDAINGAAPFREALQGRSVLGPADATKAQLEQAGAGVRAGAGAAQGAGAGPAPTATPPAGSALDQFPDLFNFINGQPKK